MKIQEGDVLRDATPEEERQILQTQKDAQAIVNAENERQQARREVLAKLGLNDEEVSLILGT